MVWPWRGKSQDRSQKIEDGRWKSRDRCRTSEFKLRASGFKTKKAMKFKFENLIIW